MVLEPKTTRTQEPKTTHTGTQEKISWSTSYELAWLFWDLFFWRGTIKAKSREMRGRWEKERNRRIEMGRGWGGMGRSEDVKKVGAERAEGRGKGGV
jgi:hypothetical protein